MEIQTLKPNRPLTFLWRLKDKYNIIVYYPGGETITDFRDRTQFRTEDFSLLYKNLDLNDGGLYQAAIRHSDIEEILAEYNVTVQGMFTETSETSAFHKPDQVSAVVLKGASVSLSPGSCTVTVTCSTQGSSLNSTFTCTNHICSEDGGDPPEVVTSAVPLQLYLSNGSILTCNHSNQVSWSNDTMDIKPLCLRNANQVSAVVLKVASVSLSPGSCTVTVTCSTQGSSLNSTFTCTNHSCSEDGGDPSEVLTSAVPLQLYLSHGSILTCNHSNQVSWSNDTMDITPLCSRNAVIHDPQKTIVIICSVLAIIGFLVVFWVCTKCWPPHDYTRSVCSPTGELELGAREQAME
ncbi:hypothetical protein N1851_022610 [Merluccius polli]|uniref:Uncharacterized protein n=1 Tax=Merluccius polli TaxID=89951 RepID=A0AA47MHZ2_MERPO|nr:hypothetical protein N1851_022610 [Merluccius polli]